MATGKSNKSLGILIIVAIIVVIAAIVIPLHRSKNTHEHLLGALDAASGAKLAVAEAAVVKGVAPSELDAADIQWNPATASNPYVAKINVGDGGRITVVTRDTGTKPDPTLVLTPTPAAKSGAIEWHCTVTEGNPAILPDRCPAETASATGASAAMAASVATAASSAAPAASAVPAASAATATSAGKP